MPTATSVENIPEVDEHTVGSLTDEVRAAF